VRLTEDPELRRRRLAVLLRLPLLLPVALVAAAWLTLALLALPVAWLAALAAGAVPSSLHRGLRAALGYAAQVHAWGSLVSGRYPSPRGRGSHPVQFAAPRERQPRWTVLARPVVAVPPLVLASVFAVVEAGTAIGAWFVALLLGRTTEGLRELGAFCVRYQTAAVAYVLLLTPGYPRLAPSAAADDQPAVEPHAAQ
jgi:hypothetical protein